MSKRVVSIGASNYIGDYILPRMLADWELQEPYTELKVESADSEEIFDQVQNGELDLGVIGSSLESDKLETREFIDNDKLILIAPADHPLASKEEISVMELKGQSFILREAGSGTRMWCREQFSRFGVSFDDLNVRAELGSHRAIITAVESGCGLALVPRRAAEESLELGYIAEINVKELSPMTGSLYMIYPKGDSISAEATEFINFLQMERPKFS